MRAKWRIAHVRLPRSNLPWVCLGRPLVESQWVSWKSWNAPLSRMAWVTVSTPPMGGGSGPTTRSRGRRELRSGVEVIVRRPAYHAVAPGPRPGCSAPTSERVDGFDHHRRLGLDEAAGLLEDPPGRAIDAHVAAHQEVRGQAQLGRRGELPDRLGHAGSYPVRVVEGLAPQRQ